MAEISEMAYSDGPSSPFVSEVGGQSRVSSKQWQTAGETECYDKTMDIFATPYKYASEMTARDVENKENNATLTNRRTSPLKTPTSPQSPASPSRQLMTDYEMMPPPTATKMTPATRRSPLKAIPSSRRTPRSRISPSPSRQSNRSNEEQDMAGYDHANIDDTCFSTFSEAPDMTTYAKLHQSPLKGAERLRTPAQSFDETPRTSRKRPSPSRSPSPTPRRLKTPASCRDGTTSFLIDFTQQFEGVTAPTHPSLKSTTEPDLLKYMNSQRSPNKSSARTSFATPSKQQSTNHLLNLLDFELPPAPTPRSVPTITVRELESLKASHQSQLSSLRATLSGREAEVESFKRAIGDAERRAAEAGEALREERTRREHVEEEKAGWEKRGLEVESLLKSVKEEVLKSEAEKDDLVRKVEEAERRIEEAELRAARAEERFEEALAARVAVADGDGAGVEEQVQKLVAAQIDAKIEAVSRELHAVYKEKHERKVATLKKSYEARNEKKCAELQAKLVEVSKENEELVAAKDNTFSGTMPDVGAETADLKTQIEEQKALIARLENEMETCRSQQAQLAQELQQERIEKGDLVAAVDEMLALQMEQGPTQETMSVVEDFRKSISRPNSIRPPGESKIGKGDLGRSTRIAPPGSKSRMLVNIERMGRSASSANNATSD